MNNVAVDRRSSHSIGLSALTVAAVMALIAVGVVLTSGRTTPDRSLAFAPLHSRSAPAPHVHLRPITPSLRSAQQVYFLRPAPAISNGETAPHGARGACRGCHRIRRYPMGGLALPIKPARGKPAQARTAPKASALPFQEVHWQGLELVALAKANARLIKAPRRAKGVVVDEVTAPADMQGFVAGDLVVAVGGLPTPDLDAFINVARKARNRRTVQIRLLRKGEKKSRILTALRGVLGDANGETAPMIPATSRMPHAYIGPCTTCHRIGRLGSLPTDRGDPAPASTNPPTIRSGQRRPHRDRGKCSACHLIR